MAHMKKLMFYCKESEDIDNDPVPQYQHKIKEIVRDVKPEDIYNCDEWDLLFPTVSDKSLSFKGDKCQGGKTS